MGKQSPGAAAAHQVQDSINDLTLAVQARSSMSGGLRKKRSDAVPFRIAQIG